MRIFGVVGALLPVLYCAGLLYYFVDFTGSIAEAERQGLGPTLLGLGVVGFLFSIPLVLKILRLMRGPGTPGPDAPENKIDVEAILARYRKRQSVAPTARRAALPQKSTDKQPRFGRKVR